MILHRMQLLSHHGDRAKGAVNFDHCVKHFKSAGTSTAGLYCCRWMAPSRRPDKSCWRRSSASPFVALSVWMRLKGRWNGRMLPGVDRIL